MLTESDRQQFERDCAPEDDAPCTVPLYHYTDGAGFIGILTNRNVRATHCRHLNDRQELSKGTELVLEVVAELASDPNTDQALFTSLKQQLERHPTHQWFMPFIASFTEKGDLLSQWRAYADNGAGYALGLDLSVPLVPGLMIFLLRCEYDETAFRDRVRTAFLKVAAVLARCLQNCTRQEDVEWLYRSAVSTLGFHVATLVTRFKAHGFHEECEWRLVAAGATDKADADLAHFGTGPRGLRPYVELPLCKPPEQIPFVKIYVGPTQDPATGLAAASLFLRKLRYPTTLLVGSEIPYRGNK